jgi:hypothetical protein
LNKEILVENMQERTLISQRLIIDHLSDIGGFNNFMVTPKCLQYVSSARSKYRTYLEDKQKDRVHSEKDEKRKALEDDIQELKSK